MTGFEHAVISVALLALSYYVGRFLGEKRAIEHNADSFLNYLEAEGFVKIGYDEDGQKILLKVVD